MKQLAVRGLDDDLVKQIRHLADQEGISLNRAVLTLLRRGAGLESGTIGSSLDHWIGTWTHDEALEMDRALRDLSHIDRGKWA